jgi:hypothetical protein
LSRKPLRAQDFPKVPISATNRSASGKVKTIGYRPGAMGQSWLTTQLRKAAITFGRNLSLY